MRDATHADKADAAGAPSSAATTDGAAVTSDGFHRNHTDHTRAARRRYLFLFVWAFVGVGLMIGAWSLATPLMAAPDEPDHVIQAVAILRGQFDVPKHQSSYGPLEDVKVPQYVGNLPSVPVCFAFHPETSAGCASGIGVGTKTVSVGTQFSNYPPLYYAIVGLPSLFLNGPSALYAMRLMGTVLDAALIALGIWLLLRYHPRQTPLLGALIALSPMALFVMAVVNSSGLEIAAGFASWCGALCVIEYRFVPRALAVWTAGALILLVLSRPASPLDAAIIATVMAVLVGWRRLPSQFNRSLRPVVIPVLVALLIAGVFLLIDGAPGLLGLPNPHPVSLLDNLWTTLRMSEGRLRQCVGDFGWLDTPVPNWVFAIWTFALAVLSVIALVVSPACRRALPLLAGLIIIMPLALESPQINAVGAYWQGRYWLPVVVGFPLVASSFNGMRVRQRLRASGVRWDFLVALILGVVLLVAQFVSFEQALQRNETGIPVQAGSAVRWLPPVGHLGLVFALGDLITLALVLTMMLRPLAMANVLEPEELIDAV